MYTSEEVACLLVDLLEEAPCERGLENESYCKSHECDDCIYREAWTDALEYERSKMQMIIDFKKGKTR